MEDSPLFLFLLRFSFLQLLLERPLQSPYVLNLQVEKQATNTSVQVQKGSHVFVQVGCFP